MPTEDIKMHKIYVSDRTSAAAPAKIEINDVDTSTTVSLIRSRISDKVSIPSTEFEMIYAGQCLRDDKKLLSYGVSEGSVINLMKKKQNNNFVEPTKNTKTDSFTVQQLILSLKAAMINQSTFRSSVNSLQKSDVMKNIIAIIPELSKDFVALNFLQDPELLMLLSDENTLKNVLDKHPCLSEAISHVLTAIKSEKSNSASEYSYSLNGLSDDEQMDSAPPLVNSSNGATGGTITPAQLASAIAAAAASSSSNAGSSVTNQYSSPTATQVTSQQSTTMSSSQPVITRDIFTQAMQQALTAVSPSSQTPDNEAQLQQLRAMGITDDAVSLQALQVTGGDVQAALELIFGDISDSNEANRSS